MAISIPLPQRPKTLSDVQTRLQNVDETCQLPCFWGVKIGYTTEKELINFLKPVAVGSNPPELQYVLNEKPGDDPIFSVSFGVKDGIVSEIEVILENVEGWLPPATLELPHLLSIMRSTPFAYLSINITTRRVFLTLVYGEGVLVQYAFELHIQPGSLTEAAFSFCPLLKENSLIQFRLRKGDSNIGSLLKVFGIPESVSRNKSWPIGRMTGMKVQEFVKRIIDKPNECIDLPSYPELLKEGYEF